jgi:hypothetical protein
MCVEAAAEAVKLNCRILGVGETLNYRSRKPRARVCLWLGSMFSVDPTHASDGNEHWGEAGMVCGSSGTVDFTQNCLIPCSSW